MKCIKKFICVIRRLRKFSALVPQSLTQLHLPLVRTHPQSPISRLRLPAAVLAVFALLSASAPTFAQPTIPLSQLLVQGFTNGPLTGYSLRVSGIRNVSSATFTDIRPEPTAGGEVQAHGGTVMLYGLNYAVAGASVDGGELSFNGSISLPPPLNQYESAVADLHGLVVGFSGNIGFDSPGGTFTIPKTFEMGALTIDEVTLTINPAAQTFGGSALIGIGKGPSGSYCPPPFSPGPPLFGASVLVVGGRMDELGLMGSNLRRPLGTTGAFLDVLGGKVGGLAANGGRNWFVQANATVNAGCAVGGVFPVSVHANATVNSTGYIAINGAADIFSIPVGNAYLRYNPPYTVAAGASVNYLGVFDAACGFQVTSGPSFSGFGRGTLTVPRYVPVAGGYVFGEAEASFNNSGFRGSVTFNVTPAIPSVCTPAFCLPGGCVHWWCPKWNNLRRTCKRCWNGPCFSAVCTPRIPAVSARIGFKFEGGSFSWNRPIEDPFVEPWELSFQHPIVDEANGNRMSFMYNWSRLDKWTTGSHGRSITPTGGRQRKDADPPPLPFTVPGEQESVMFRLTWENPENSLVFMTLRYSDYPTLNCVSDEVSTNYSRLSAIDSWASNAYCLIDGTRREAIIGLPYPPAGTYYVQISHTNGLGNYAVELLSQNPTPVVFVSSVQQSEQPIEYGVNFTTFVGEIPPTNSVTRFLLAQSSADPTDPLKRIKTGPVYVADSFPTANGTFLRYFHTDALQIPPGEYTLVVSVDGSSILEVEAFSQQKVTIFAGAAPQPVPSFATRGEVGGFTVQWQPSPSPGVDEYVVRYTKGSAPDEFEAQQSFAANQSEGKITGLENGRPYLVTIQAMSTNGLPSANAEVQRVIPTEGYGLNAPFITSTPNRVATAGWQYTYFPAAYDADDSLRPPGPVPDGETDEGPSEPQDGHGRQWTLVAAPAGMAIEPSGMILWTPTAEQVGNHQVTVRVTDLASLPPRQETNSLVRPQFGEQTYTVTVVGPNQPPQFTRNHYRFLTSPNDTAYAGEVYRYVPFLLAPTNRFALTVDAGPPGLAVIQEGTEPNVTNVVVWAVPSDATGHRVVLRALPHGPDTTGDDTVIQEFFLSVSAPEKQLPLPVVINGLTRTPEGFGLRWVGSASTFQVQRSTNLQPTGTLWEDITSAFPASAVNFHVDTNPPPARAFYRILSTP